MRIVMLLGIIAIAVVATNPALAIDVSRLQCGLKVVYLGDLEHDVLSKCGSPTATQGNLWIYDRGYPGPYAVIYSGGGGKYRRRVMRIELKNR